MRAHRRHGLIVALFGVLAIGAPSPSVAQQPIKIGASISITGRDAVQGGYVREGYLLCQKHVNEKGGALGRPIQLVIHDDGSEGKAAIRIYEKLITEDKVDAVMGPYSSLMVAPGAGTTAIWEKGRRYLVMVLSPLEASTEGTIDLAARNGLKTIGVIGTLARPAIAKGALEVAKKKGLELVVHEMFPIGTTDFSAILNRVKAAKPDALVVGAPPADAIAITRQMRELDVNVKMYGATPGAAYPDYQKALGKTVEFHALPQQVHGRQAARAPPAGLDGSDRYDQGAWTGPTTQWESADRLPGNPGPRIVRGTGKAIDGATQWQAQ